MMQQINNAECLVNKTEINCTVYTKYLRLFVDSWCCSAAISLLDPLCSTKHYIHFHLDFYSSFHLSRYRDNWEMSWGKKLRLDSCQ